MTLFFLFFVVLPILIVVFTFCLFPVWMLVDCAISREIPSGHKIAWILAILLVWPIGAFLYAFIASRTRYLKMITTILLLLSVLIILFLVRFGLSSLGNLQTGIATSINQVDQLNHVSVTDAEMLELKYNLKILSDEANGKPWDRNTLNALQLVELFNVQAQDGVISREEFNNWMSKFQTRELIDNRALESYIRKLKVREGTDPRKDVQL